MPSQERYQRSLCLVGWWAQLWPAFWVNNSEIWWSGTGKLTSPYREWLRLLFLEMRCLLACLLVCLLAFLLALMLACLSPCLLACLLRTPVGAKNLFRLLEPWACHFSCHIHYMICQGMFLILDSSLRIQMMGAIMKEVWIRKIENMFMPENSPTFFVTTFRMV